jgi:hypothetical protein
MTLELAYGTAHGAVDSYPTSEVATSKRWVGGEVIYRKLIATGALPSSADTLEIAHGITGYATVVDMYGTVTDGTDIWTVPKASYQVDTFRLGMDATNLTIQVGQNWGGFSGHITVEYTKT